jgi:hypothetical protein
MVLNSDVSGTIGISFVRPNRRNEACVAANSNATPLRCCERYHPGSIFFFRIMCHMPADRVNPVQAKTPIRNEPTFIEIPSTRIPYIVSTLVSNWKLLVLYASTSFLWAID